MSALSPQLLREIGEALAGRWSVRPLAALLEVAPRTIERWLTEQSSIPPGIGPELGAAIDGKIAELRALRRKLRS